jgi:hypothetical protein
MQRLVVNQYKRFAPLAYRALAGALRRGSYRRWVKLYDTFSDSDREAILADLRSWTQPPLISVVMPVFNTPERYLRKALASVVGQLYPNWELCIADDASTARHVRAVLAEYATRDSRIRIVSRPTNGGISEATNSAIDLATGEYIGFLDHDDVLPAHALYMVAREIARDAKLDLVYSDEDKISRWGRRYDPHFKSDWNPDLFLTQNMISHLGVYRTSLVRKVGGLRVNSTAARIMISRCELSSRRSRNASAISRMSYIIGAPLPALLPDLRARSPMRWRRRGELSGIICGGEASARRSRSPTGRLFSRSAIASTSSRRSA